MNHVLCVCGVTLFVSTSALAGVQVFPTSYDMPNGETGKFTYFDDSYNGTGDIGIKGDALTGGLGDLTDGVIATTNWFNEPGTYVGWDSITPTITFRFAQAYQFDSAIIFVDDANGNGGVSTPGSIDLLVNGVSTNIPLLDGDSGAPLSFSLPINELTDTVTITLNDGAAQWVFLSEVQFFGVPTPGTVGVLDGAALVCFRRRR